MKIRQFISRTRAWQDIKIQSLPAEIAFAVKRMANFFFFISCRPVYIFQISSFRLIDTSIDERMSAWYVLRKLRASYNELRSSRDVCRWYYVNKSIRKIRLFLIRQNRSRIALVFDRSAPLSDPRFVDLRIIDSIQNRALSRTRAAASLASYLQIIMYSICIGARMTFY